MTSSISSRTIEFASGETIALDLRNAVWPIGFTIRPAAGATITRKAANGKRPGNKYANPPENDSLTANFPFGQMSPISFAVFSASAGAGAIDISAHEAQDIEVHNSADDTITALVAPTPSVAVGESIVLAPTELFGYPKGSLDLTATSATPATATAVSNQDTGEIGITGVAVGTVNVTVTATSPTETTESVVVAVTVTA